MTCYSNFNVLTPLCPPPLPSQEKPGSTANNIHKCHETVHTQPLGPSKQTSRRSAAVLGPRWGYVPLTRASHGSAPLCRSSAITASNIHMYTYTKYTENMNYVMTLCTHRSSTRNPGSTTSNIHMYTYITYTERT